MSHVPWQRGDTLNALLKNVAYTIWTLSYMSIYYLAFSHSNQILPFLQGIVKHKLPL